MLIWKYVSKLNFSSSHKYIFSFLTLIHDLERFILQILQILISCYFWNKHTECLQYLAEIKADGNYLGCIPRIAPTCATLAPDSVSNSTSRQKRYYLVHPRIRPTVPFRNSVGRLHLAMTNFPGKQGDGCAHDERRIEIRNFYMCPDRIDFRICRQHLPSVAPPLFYLLSVFHFPDYELLRYSRKEE